MKKNIFIASILIAIMLAACGATPAPTMVSTDLENTALAANQVAVTLTQTPLPAAETLPSIKTPTNTSLATDTLGIGSTWTGIDGMTLLYVPAGEFTMGSDAGAPDEKPVHTVYLDTYWIDQTEVTNAMYTLCVQSGECIDHSDAIHKANPDFDTSAYANPLYANYAVVYVSWKDAAAYCEWAGRRLPTEAEWEKAASWDDKTKTKHIYPWGDNLDCSYVNYYDNHNVCGYGGGPIKSYESGKSSYGAYDMAGNVWEWVNDWYGKTYYQSSPSVNPLGPDSGLQRVMRGGYNFHPNDMRSASRSAYYQGAADYTTGFRCAQSADKINTEQTPVPAATASIPYPTTAPISFHVQPATNQGDRFTAKTDGIYRFTIEKGAIRSCPPDPNLPDCGTWNSQLMVHKNRILWGSYENRNVPRTAENLFPLGDFGIGVYYPAIDQAAAEEANMGRYTDIPLKKDDYLIFIPYDCQSCYGDNEGGVDISVSIIGALP